MPQDLKSFSDEEIIKEALARVLVPRMGDSINWDSWSDAWKTSLFRDLQTAAGRKVYARGMEIMPDVVARANAIYDEQRERDMRSISPESFVVSDALRLLQDRPGLTPEQAIEKAAEALNYAPLLESERIEMLADLQRQLQTKGNAQ